MTPFDIVPRPVGAPVRDRLGEGPFWSEAEQALYWVDIAGRRAMRVDPMSGEGRCWALPLSCSAIAPGRGGPVVALKDGLYRLEPQTGAISLFARPDPDPGNRSNEMRCDPFGAILLGAMDDNLSAEGEPVPQTRRSGGFFRVFPDGRSQRLISGIGIANTLAWSPSGARLYCADTTRRVIWSFAYDPEGPLSNRQVLVEDGPGWPDGSAVDEEGCLWNARWGAGVVIRYRPDGGIDQVLPLPVAQPSSCAFGDADRKTLFVTSARIGLPDLDEAALDGSVLAIRTDVAGLPMTPFAG